MRRFLVGLVVAAAAIAMPSWAMAAGPNEDAANRIAAGLKQSGKLHGYKISIKYQDGVVWLKGEVASPEQIKTAVETVQQMPGVTRVVDNLTTSSAAASGADKAQPSIAAMLGRPASSPQPVDGALAAEQLPQTMGRDARTTMIPATQVGGVAQRVPTSFTPSPVQPTGVEEQQEPTPAPARTASRSAPQMPTVDSRTVAAVSPASVVTQRANGGVSVSPAQVPGPGVVTNGVPLPAGQAAPLPLQANGQPMPVQAALPVGAAGVRYDQPHLPNYAWPGYAAYPNYAAVTYPKQYSPTAWPYIGPFYPYPQVPLGWRKVTLEWHDGWWHLDFDDGSAHGPFSGLFRPFRRHDL